MPFIEFNTITKRLLGGLAILAAVCSSQAVEIIGHRGASYDAPENTLASFKLGWEQHADAVELDIWLTKDGKIAVMHDGNTKRTAGVDKDLGEQTLAELRTPDAGSWKDPRWKGEKIPTLDEVLAAIPQGRKLVIEIKCGPEILPELERVVTASKRKPSELVIISFKYDSVAEAKKRFPEIPAFLLVSFKQNKITRAWSPTIEELIGKAKAAKIEGINVSFKGPLIPSILVA